MIGPALDRAGEDPFVMERSKMPFVVNPGPSPGQALPNHALRGQQRVATIRQENAPAGLRSRLKPLLQGSVRSWRGRTPPCVALH